MSVTTVLPLVALVALVGAVVWLLSRPKRPAEIDEDVAAVDREREELERSFYERASGGEPVRPVARIYAQTDAAAIQALMSSVGIALIRRNAEMNVLRTGAPVRGLNDCVFVVLQEDYDKAVEVIRDYLEDQAKADNGVTAAAAARNVAETIVAGTFVNPSAGRPEIL